MNLERVVVIDEAELTELVHEEADAGPRGADHFRQHLLTDLGKDRFGLAVLAEVGQQEENPGQLFLAGVEELIDQIFFNASVPLEEVSHEPGGKSWLGLQHPEHLFFGDLQDGCLGKRSGGEQSHRLTVQTALTEETVGVQYGDDGLFPALGNDCQLDPATLDKEHGLCRVALPEDDLSLSAGDYRSSLADFRQE